MWGKTPSGWKLAIVDLSTPGPLNPGRRVRHTLFNRLTSPTLWSSVHRRDPAGRRSVGEGESGVLFLSGVRGKHKCAICSHRDRGRHHHLWPVWLLRHVPRQPMDAQAGQCRCSAATPCNSADVWSSPCVYSLQYAMFLTLMFLAELVAGISGFIFRHEVSWSFKRDKQYKAFKFPSLACKMLLTSTENCLDLIVVLVILASFAAILNLWSSVTSFPRSHQGPRILLQHLKWRTRFTVLLADSSRRLKRLSCSVTTVVGCKWCLERDGAFSYYHFTCSETVMCWLMGRLFVYFIL